MMHTIRVGGSPIDPGEPPVWEIPGILAQELIISRSRDIVISWGNIRVFSRGVLSAIFVRFNPEHDADGESRGQDFTMALKGVDQEGLLVGMTTGKQPLAVDQFGGHGGHHLWELQYWVYPLPLEGLRVSAQWSAQGIGRGHVDLTSSEVATLRTSVRDLTSR
jgi:hypothetical protein